MPTAGQGDKAGFLVSWVGVPGRQASGSIGAMRCDAMRALSCTFTVRMYVCMQVCEHGWVYVPYCVTPRRRQRTNFDYRVP